MAGERILVVDDEPGVRSMLEVILKDEGYGVTAVASGEEGVKLAEKGEFDALLLDVWLPGIDGIETLSRVRAKGIDSEVVMISGHGTIDTAVKATKAGAFDFVEKPLALEKTLLVVRNALRQRRLERRNRSLLEQLSRDTEVLGDSEAARRVRHAVDAAAASDAPCLICGEDGVGRTTVARRIHAGSRRSERPLVVVPCGAFDAARGATELLGGGEGQGRLALAERGSLLLEDADRLPAEAQERLAARLSGTEDVRALATVPPDARGLVPALKSRLDVIRIDVPALRERREDVEILARRFLDDLTREYGRVPKRLAPDAVAALVRSDWPGNVRALRNVVERLGLLAPGAEIGANDLPSDLGGATPAADDLYAAFPSLEAGRRVFERYFLRRALREAHGDVQAAARRAGVSEQALREMVG